MSVPSKCRKVNAVFNLITSPNGLMWILVTGSNNTWCSRNIYFLFDASVKIIQPNKAKPYSVFIFNDVSCQNKDTIRNYFAMGRHHNEDFIYIGQT